MIAFLARAVLVVIAGYFLLTAIGIPMLLFVGAIWVLMVLAGWK